MASPRVFISSTFYDLRQIRSDLERFVRDLGYDPVMHEKGNVPYGKEVSLDEYCYREIAGCDIIVSIVGSRFGSSATNSSYSVSQTELRVAIEHNKSVYVFVEQSVMSEFDTFLKNRGNDSISYAKVDDTRIFSFIDEIKKLPNNNPIFHFSTVADIGGILKQQWAGLLKNLLNESGRAAEQALLRELKSSLNMVRQVIDSLAKERSQQGEMIQNIVTQNHPIFARIAELTSTPYRVFFTNVDEMEKWLKARAWKREEIDEWDDTYLWVKWLSKTHGRRIEISMKAFTEDGKLDTSVWESNWLSHEDLERPPPPPDDLDDEIPF